MYKRQSSETFTPRQPALPAESTGSQRVKQKRQAAPIAAAAISEAQKSPQAPPPAQENVDKGGSVGIIVSSDVDGTADDEEGDEVPVIFSTLL